MKITTWLISIFVLAFIPGCLYSHDSKSSVGDMSEELNKNPNYLDNKSSLPKVIEWFETNSRIHVLKPQDYTKMEYFLTRGPNVFIAKLPLEKEELKKIMLHDSIKWKRDISDEASKFYYAVMKEDENDYKKFMNNLNNEDLLFFFLKDANQKKLYLLDSDSKFIFFYYFKN